MWELDQPRLAPALAFGDDSRLSKDVRAEVEHLSQ
jgi:hypothetical protein